jgi:hypothetical protein
MASRLRGRTELLRRAAVAFLRRAGSARSSHVLGRVGRWTMMLSEGEMRDQGWYVDGRWWMVDGGW